MIRTNQDVNAGDCVILTSQFLPVHTTKRTKNQAVQFIECIVLGKLNRANVDEVLEDGRVSVNNENPCCSATVTKQQVDYLSPVETTRKLRTNKQHL